jgi:hypothetical protein
MTTPVPILGPDGFHADSPPASSAASLWEGAIHPERGSFKRASRVNGRF